jgi:hypothetical protein
MRGMLWARTAVWMTWKNEGAAHKSRPTFLLVLKPTGLGTRPPLLLPLYSAHPSGQLGLMLNPKLLI